MSFPINGRIAIIDDNIDQARPLIEVLSSKQYPFTYYSGEFKFLPNKDEFCNDIRVLFLDINLIDDSVHDDKVLRARLVPVLQRIISPKNFPFVIVYWSRNEQNKNLIKDIFNEDLKDRKPIGYLEESKLNYFDFKGDKVEGYEESITQLFDKIDLLLNEKPAFSYLLHWENLIHISADNTLEETFSFKKSQNTWEQDANYIFNKLGKSYAGKHFDSSSLIEKVNSSFQSMNSIFLDTIEFNVNTNNVKNAQTLDSEIVKDDIIPELNRKLICSDHIGDLKYSGVVMNELNATINIIDELTIIKVKPPEMENHNKDIREHLLNVIINVTPLCDFIQKKQKIDRLARGILIESRFRKNLDDKSEALFFSPDFQHNNRAYFLVLDFRYFFTDDIQSTGNIAPIFRLRQQILSEIQSKLARHISRQGILFL
jgi:hypothetical protein